ncbi:MULTISPECIES: BMP family lipoprotein [Brachybacterium]|uniref:BMP family ABC transporter substrate-binding protein n=1 Tax=Brachybacterium alimentarium TaxID=47845 RepID=A0A2A3YIL0_9MICO|nr:MULTISPECIES: BMP family ABC transporter substrate-binding protein [Brachybacterium]PCC35634.1 BMP family ABC transporter substrate-binding protein [Brachybacterium alimentarium]PCC39160.1 BMP family ABC transporter substrate-binding protein [Brachybacterium alimentarium]RCS64702.1 BMP family ABC transporter substrate-binding protein [Brachybacterium sp. JB7]RCS66583.1 BMP family ABC transporter substrate-binding protein [Brachybacterium alimentarium]RCS67984.1 BMP family ABC transporter su
MKSFTRALALTGAGVLTLAACGTAPDEGGSGSSDAGGAGSDYKACMVSDAGGWDDKSFNESSHDGLLAAEKNLGIEKAEAESSSDSDFAPNINNMVTEGCDLIVTVGFLLAPATGAAGEANQDTDFAIVDSTAQDADGSPITLDNVKPIEFNTAEAAFLAGYLAAGMSETGKVATYGGMNIPTVTIFMDGYADGVAYYNETKDADVQVLGWNKDTQEGSIVGTFDDQSKGKAVSDEFYNAGADIIMPVAGPVGAGTLASAKEGEDRSVIWVDADGYETNASDEDAQSVIMTSVMKEMGTAVEDVISVSADGEFDATPYVGTLENGGVGLAPFHDFEDDVPEELSTELDTLKQDIIDGTVTVESKASPKEA